MKLIDSNRGERDAADPRVKVRFRLEKFDGAKKPGDGKRPVEVITGGDGRETKIHKGEKLRRLLAEEGSHASD